MGIQINGSRWLELMKHSYGVNFEKSAILGRQFCEFSEKDLRKYYPNNKVMQEDGYAEAFFRFLGAKEVVSYDYSDYEKADYIHDFNKPIPKTEEGKYSMVLDGGSLEHILNFVVAIQNLMKMVKVNGHLLFFAPSNNQYGHGFYQFSADLFCQVLVNNGFEVNDITWHDYKLKWHSDINKRKMYCHYYKIYDPLKGFNSYDVDYGSAIFICAKKVFEVSEFNVAQQGVYVDLWQGKESQKKVVSRQYYDMESELFCMRGEKKNTKPSKVYFWGGGVDFTKYTESSRYHEDKEILEIKACIDIDYNKQGENINGVSIVSPEVILREDFDVVVISSSKYEKEIRRNLISNYNIDDEKIWNMERYNSVMGPRVYSKV